MYHQLRKNSALTGIATEIEVFTPDECDTLISLALSLEEMDVPVFTKGGLKKDTSIRSASQFVMTQDKFPGLHSHIKKVFQTGNFLKFAYHEIPTIQIIRYREGDFYLPHTDWSVNKVRRKLSLSIQLSPEDDYVGGEVVIHAGPESVAISKQMGVGAIWPSWTLHEVKPIVRGERWALVAWAEGTPFS
jgi:PKHD-type hydroxylase